MNVRRSRFLIPVLVLMFGVMALAACGESDGPELPDTTAASVIAYLDEVNYQESWELWPGLGEKVEGGDPHGMLLTTYLNPVALQAFNDKAGTMPDGAIIVKENYTPDGTLAANTLMYKKSGYNPDHNDWFWLKVLADGTVDKQGMVEGCQNCHGEDPRQRLRLDRAAEIARTFRGNLPREAPRKPSRLELGVLESVVSRSACPTVGEASVVNVLPRSASPSDGDGGL